VEQLTEIIRCSGDHFTLLRPLHQDQGGQQLSGGYRVRTLRLSSSPRSLVVARTLLLLATVLSA
jgi:hypothetical protein